LAAYALAVSDWDHLWSGRGIRTDDPYGHTHQRMTFLAGVRAAKD